MTPQFKVSVSPSTLLAQPRNILRMDGRGGSVGGDEGVLVWISNKLCSLNRNLSLFISDPSL